MKRDPRRAPPKVRPGLIVGITGHRKLPHDAEGAIGEAIAAVLTGATAAAERVVRTEAAFFSDEPLRRVMISPLAEGADQIAAEAALAAGWSLRAVLPFAAEEYALDFEGEPRRRLDALLTRTEGWWSLPADRSSEDEGYALAGQATVAQSDLILAVWDGKVSRGLGGTADVLELAIRRGVPVIWIADDGSGAPTLLWAGLDELDPSSLDRATAPRRPLTPEILDWLIERLLAPPAAEEEREALRFFFDERQRRFRLRQEYPLLLALTGAKPWKIGLLRAPRYVESARADWKAFREKGAAANPVLSDGLDRLEAAFGWADGLADHYAQSYRSGFVFNYAAAALAVLIGLASFIWPEHKPALLLGELATIALLIGNTVRGSKRQWHRRWLNYRYLAERLRPMRSLALFSAASPNFQPGQGADRPWMDWYAAAVWRDLGVRPTLENEAAVGETARHVAASELRSQIAYNQMNARRMHLVEHRLHVVGARLFELTALIAVVSLVGIELKIVWLKAMVPVLTVLSVALPVAGGALFSMRGQGDFVGAQGRSESTAARLQAAVRRLEAETIDLASAARATEDAAATMLSDLDEWRLSYRHRKLAIPA